MSKIHVDTHIHMGYRNSKEGFQYNWQLEDLNNFKLPQGKAFFVFGGNTTNCAEAANGNAKVIESLLSNENKDKTNIYSFIYDAEPISSTTLKLRDEYETEMHQIFEKIFKPMMLDRIGNLKEQQGIEKNFKNIILVSHCGGSDFVNVLIEDIYKTLTTKYHASIADQLISKIQYFSYAPHVLPERKLNSFVIAPFFDINNSWAKVLHCVEDKRVDLDYPKGIMKTVLKAQKNGNPASLIMNALDNNKVIALRSAQTTYLIPSRINSNVYVGDHSIDCLVKKNVLETNTEQAKTAAILNYSAKITINQFASEYGINSKEIFEKISNKIYDGKIKHNNSSCDDADGTSCNY